MARTKRPLRFGRKRSVLFPQYADDILVKMASGANKGKGITVSHQIRRIVLRQVHIYIETKKKKVDEEVDTP